MSISKRVPLRKTVEEGEWRPAWYGVAYFDYATNYAVCYPIPLNIVVRVYRIVQYFLLWLLGTAPWLKDPWKRTYERGRMDGKEEMVREALHNAMAEHQREERNARETKTTEEEQQPP